MKKIIIVMLVLLLVGCSAEESDKLKVAVSIVPEAGFVKAVAGDLVDVVVLIPPGFSPANYEPSPKLMADFNDSDLYFHIDVAAEGHILESVNNPDMKLIDLADISDGVYPARYFDQEDAHEEAIGSDEDHQHEGRDPHIWLSPKRVMVMVEAIKDELTLADPENGDLYAENAAVYITQLKSLDQELKDAFAQYTSKTFLIYHPSYGYFADDYGLEMIAIEEEGKAATIQGMEAVIETALAKHIRVIFYQEEFDSQQAEIIANEISGVTVAVNPLAEDYITALKAMAEELKDILN